MSSLELTRGYKDNIATDDRIQTTAGSHALVNSKVPGVFKGKNHLPHGRFYL